MMRKYLSAGVLALLLVLSIGTAYADWIPGSINELVNGDFETGNWGPWEHGAGLALGVDGIVNNWGVYCKYPTQNLLLRQVVDETLNVNNWDWSKNWKEIDLMADIRCVWAEGDPGHPTSTVSFRLDWWSDEGKPEWWEPQQIWDNVGNQMVYVPGDFHSRWVTYGFTENSTWSTVNPFANDMWVLHDAAGNPMQPKWVSVEILIDQSPTEQVWVDNVILTSKCIPEPMSLVLGFMGLGSVAGLRRMFRR